MNQKIRTYGVLTVVAVWALLAGFSWFGPRTEVSEAERRPLAQFPELTVETILSGDFMVDFEDYTLDQFPVRDTFRQLKDRGVALPLERKVSGSTVLSSRRSQMLKSVSRGIPNRFLGLSTRSSISRSMVMRPGSTR